MHICTYIHHMFIQVDRGRQTHSETERKRERERERERHIEREREQWSAAHAGIHIYGGLSLSVSFSLSLSWSEGSLRPARPCRRIFSYSSSKKKHMLILLLLESCAPARPAGPAAACPVSAGCPLRPQRSPAPAQRRVYGLRI
jgi:hypothetical protein